MLGPRGPGTGRQNAPVNMVTTPPALAPRAPSCPTPAAVGWPSGPMLGTRSADGFTLIEVMVALIVLVLGVLGAASMTLTALRDNKQSSLRSYAVALAYEVGDLMRMNPGQETVFTGGAPTAVSSCYGAGCSPTDMANNDYALWREKLSTPGILPNATAVICRDAANPTSMACDGLSTSPMVVKIRWDEKRNDGTYDANAGPRLVVPMAPTCFPSLSNPNCATP